MVLFPDVQKKAQAELDRVVGQARLPEFDDIDDVPYIRAIAMETMRWMPVTPFGVAHATISEDEYRGYHIPKGTMILPVSLVFLLLIRSDRFTEYMVGVVPRIPSDDAN